MKIVQEKIHVYVSRFQRFFRRYPVFYMLIGTFSIVGVLLYSIGGTLQYYFYSDDYAVLYHLQRKLPLGWPYDGEYFVVFKPLFYLLGTQPFGYFALGVATYGLATLSVYLFFRTLTKNSIIAYATSLIFATGYVGISQYNMMIVSITNNLSITGILAVLTVYYLWIVQKRFRYYLISLGLFFLSLKLFPFRTFTLILFVPTVELFFGSDIFRRFQIRKIVRSALFLLPFYIIGKNSGVFGYGNFGFAKLLTYASPAMLAEYFTIFGRLILPEQVLTFLGYPIVAKTYLLAGLTAILFCSCIVLTVLIRNKKNKLNICLPFALIMTLEAYLGFFLLMPTFGTGAPASRYLPVTFISFSALLPLVVFETGELLFQKRNVRLKRYSVFVIIVYCFALMLFSHKYVISRVRDQGPPAVLFYSQIKEAIPIMPAHLTVYIDSANYYPAISRLGNILPRALFTPEVAFAVLYNVPISNVTYTSSLDEFIRRFTHPEKGEEFYSFYYDGLNLHNTTNNMLKSFKSDEAVIIAQKIQAIVPNDKKIVIIDAHKIPSFGKQELELTMRLSPLDENRFSYPYFEGSPSGIQRKEIAAYFDRKQIDRSQIFSYFTGRKAYYNTVQISGTESEKEYPQTRMVDNRLDTYWVDAEHLWELRPKFKLSLVIDLGTVKQISRVVWLPLTNREPSKYTVFLSFDNRNWQRAQIHSTRSEEKDLILVSDTFAPVWTRYIKYDISDTRNGNTPGIKELEVIEYVYNAIDPFVAWRVGDFPFEYITSRADLMQSYDYISKYGTARIFTKTNKEDVLNNQYFTTVPVYVDGLTHTYKIPFHSRGTKLEEIGIDMEYPIQISIDQVRVLQQQVIP